jgi:hypothetical protein
MKRMFLLCVASLMLALTGFIGIGQAKDDPPPGDVWVNGYYRSDGTYVKGHWRTAPNLRKDDNYSYNGDPNDVWNDRSFYNQYGYDPEPWDNESPF